MFLHLLEHKHHSRIFVVIKLSHTLYTTTFYDSLLLTSLANFVRDDFVLSLEPLTSIQRSVELIAIGPRNTFCDYDFLFSRFVTVSYCLLPAVGTAY